MAPALDTSPEPAGAFVRPAPLRSFRSIELPPPPTFSARPLAPAPRHRPTAPPPHLAPTAPPAPPPAPLPHYERVSHAGSPIPAISGDRLAHPSAAAPRRSAPVQVRASLTRRDGALGFAVAMLVMVVVLAAALAMQRSMHGWPPGSF